MERQRKGLITKMQMNTAMTKVQTRIQKEFEERRHRRMSWDGKTIKTELVMRIVEEEIEAGDDDDHDDDGA
eukprot:12171846-Karenia_brevis.AAC.1